MSELISDQDSVASPEVLELPIKTIRNTGRFNAFHRPPKQYWEATPCEGPGCTNIIPAGLYQPQRTRSFCSKSCGYRDAGSKYIVGECPHCGGPVMGRKDEVGIKVYCCDEHWRAHSTEQILGPTGVFRGLIEEYMATAAANYYSPGTLPTVRVSLAKFFRFAVQIEEITALDDVRPAVITRFIALERERGLTGRNFVGHLSTFFGTLIVEEKYGRANPVVSRIHSQRGAPAEARPYNDRDLNMIWECVERTGKLQLMLAFAIGEECGLRIGEVQNIRLSDIDASAQTIFVRLPTKNKRTRTVPFHCKVKKYLELWLAKRNPDCTHDHLLHNNASKPFTGTHFDAWFKKALSKAPDPACAFKFHRLRHSWATRLMNNGMELAVLKELGGWQSWSSMQRYIKVLDSTVRGQYEASYARLQEKQESGEDEAISLVDFALMNAAQSASLNAPTT
jgi:integrase